MVDRLQTVIADNETTTNEVSKQDVLVEVSEKLNDQNGSSTNIQQNTESAAENSNEISANIKTSNSELELSTQMNENTLENMLNTDNNIDDEYIPSTDTGSHLSPNEGDIMVSSPLMPKDLISQVLSSTPTSNTPSERHALCGLWDFAGQKEFYATHQAFLTSTAIYLLVADIADDICKKGVKQYFADFHNVGGIIINKYNLTSVITNNNENNSF
ncbi:unnamed protein product [Mytilus edulis]|uniref:Uncharacterized protein n=1 Tax=Mytilus edulis TaxID=6550 RepID=A0A8S3RNX0_MYTED|nr:unnamed protein product [Mytilus edulis]